MDYFHQKSLKKHSTCNTSIQCTMQLYDFIQDSDSNAAKFSRGAESSADDEEEIEEDIEDDFEEDMDDDDEQDPLQ